MYDKLVKEICVNVYDELSKYNIKGDDKKKFMEKNMFCPYKQYL